MHVLIGSLLSLSCCCEQGFLKEWGVCFYYKGETEPVLTKWSSGLKRFLRRLNEMEMALITRDYRSDTDPRLNTECQSFISPFGKENKELISQIGQEGDKIKL